MINSDVVMAVLQFGALGLLGAFMFFYIKSQEKRQAAHDERQALSDKRQHEETEEFIKFLFEVTATLALLNERMENAASFMQAHDLRAKDGQEEIKDSIRQLSARGLK